MRILGIDPGTRFCGLAMLVDGQPDVLQTLCRNGLHHNGELLAQEWFRRLRSFVREQNPDTIIYEDYVFQSHARTSENAPEMWQLIGAIQCLGVVQYYPYIGVVAPMVWRKQLLGNLMPRRAGKMDAAVGAALCARFPTDPRLASWAKTDGHTKDALGIAVTWADTQALLAREKISM